MQGDNDQNDWDNKTVLQPEGLKPFNVSEELDDVSEKLDDLGDNTRSALGERLALGDEERLPWLESADDVDGDDEESGNGRLIGFALAALLALATLIGGIWYATNRNSVANNADGSLIEASKAPYKVAPSDPGGKTFAGTGDSSFKVSEGEKPVANLAGSNGATRPASPLAKPSAAASGTATASAATGSTAPSAPATGGVGVQIGAFSTQATAESGWQKLLASHDALKGFSHRVIEGKADIGTVYRLQAVAGDASAADALCRKLQAGGLKCQVKR